MRIAILGNAGSGKTTLARSMSRDAVPILDLDTIVWEPNAGAICRPLNAARNKLQKFCSRQSDWIVEGCYGDLIEAALAWHPELIFLNPGEEICLRNCRNRQWEPHKYPSKAEKDSIRETLFDWVSAYYTCTGSMSLAGHQAIYDAYDGPKRELTGFSIESHG